MSSLILVASPLSYLVGLCRLYSRIELLNTTTRGEISIYVITELNIVESHLGHMRIIYEDECRGLDRLSIRLTSSARGAFLFITLDTRIS